jgi:hypothetical protein
MQPIFNLLAWPFNVIYRVVLKPLRVNYHGCHVNTFFFLEVGEMVTRCRLFGGGAPAECASRCSPHEVRLAMFAPRGPPREVRPARSAPRGPPRINTA